MGLDDGRWNVDQSVLDVRAHVIEQFGQIEPVYADVTLVASRRHTLAKVAHLQDSDRRVRNERYADDLLGPPVQVLISRLEELGIDRGPRR